MAEQSRAPEQENDAFSSALNGILGNPEMMSMISSMAQKLKGGESEQKVEESPPNDAVPINASPAVPQNDLSGAISALAPLLSGGFGKQSKQDNDRACLLRALKPYLSQGRCEAIEYIIKFSKLSEVLKNLS